MSDIKAKAEELVKIDFRNIAVETIDMKVQKMDFSKELANAIYSQTKDLGEVEMARKMYNMGIVELTKDEAKKIFEEYISKFWPGYVINSAFKTAMKL